MTIRQRYFGSDTPFCAWMRSQKQQLPSWSRTYGYVASDVDLHVHVYNTPVDGIGTREIQSLMFLEVKSRGGDVPQSQLDTLAKVNACISRRTVEFSGQLVRHFGVSFLFMSGETPDSSDILEWGRFDVAEVVRKPITMAQLFDLLRFDIHPGNLRPKPYRRHHKTRRIVETIQTPLGFFCDELVIKRS